MFTVKSIDGEPVPKEYQEAISHMIKVICDIEDEIEIFELDGGKENA